VRLKKAATRPTIRVVSKAASIFIATVSPEVEQLGDALAEEGIHSRVMRSADEALVLLEQARNPLLVLDCDLERGDVRRLYDRAHGFPAIPLLIISGPDGPGFKLRSARGRLEERVTQPAQALELALRVKALMLRAGYSVPARPVVERQVTTPVEASEDGRTQGEVVAVFSVKGGAGKSTIAVNLAVGLAQIYRRKTLLVDADVWFGDVGVLLDVKGGRSLADICDGEDVDLFGLPKAVIPHSSGISVLQRPPNPVTVEKLNPRVVARTITTYKSLYEYVLVDTGPSLDDLNLQILDVADRILLVATPELTAIHNCSRFLVLAETLGYSDKIALVLNRANSGIDGDSIINTLQVPILSRVVSAGRLVVEAANAGTSIMQMDPLLREPITQDFARLVELVVGQPRPEHLAAPAAAKPSEPWRRKLPFFRMRAA
jgi:pilus assembly protein CpaE